MAEAHVRAEGAIADVIDLLTELRSTRGFARRGRLAALAARAVAGLTPEQRRQLAVDVAARAAPQLVERIEADTDLDLSPAQVRAVVEMVGNLDRNDVDALVATLQDPDWQRRAAARALSVDDVAEDEEGWFQDEDGTWYRYEDEPEPGTAAEPEEDLEHGPEPVDEARPLAPVEPPDGPREPPEPQVTPSAVAAYATSLPDMADWRADGLAADQFAFARPAPRDRGHAERPDRPEPSTPEELEQSWFGGGSLDIAPVAPTRTELGERLRSVERSAEQLRTLLAAADEFAVLSPGEQSSVLRHLRAPWVRRRAVLALIEGGRVTRDSAGALVRAFDSGVNRAWIVASLVEAGLGSVDEFTDLLTPAAAARLARRYAA